MIHNEKKAAKIVEELTVFFFALGASRIRSEVEKKAGQLVIHFISDYRAEYRSRLVSLEKYLKESCNTGVEDIYWELAGTGEPGDSSQLLLIGMMTDDAQVSIEEDKVELILYKNLDN